jgi:predicted transcriptional regulator of viral defense system
MNKATITTIAVSVRNSSRSQLAFSGNPFSAIQFATTRILAIRKMIPIPGSEDRRYGLVKRAIANGEIIHTRRGLYCLAPKYQKKTINLYALAQHVYGPSYIILESALSCHGWIPEAVYTMTSVSFKKAKEFNTTLGVFSYNRVPQKLFYAGVERLADEEGNIFLMAKPIKALSDYVYVQKKDWTGLKPVVESLRVEEEEFTSLTVKCARKLVINSQMHLLSG